MLKKLFGSEDDGKLQPGDEELIGTSIFGDDDFENVPDWIQKQIHKIRNKGLGDSPEELTHELVGKTFIYRLDFDGPNGEILGVYRTLKGKEFGKQSKAKQGKTKSPKPNAQYNWQLLGSRFEPNMGEVSYKNWDKVPIWVQKEIQKIQILSSIIPSVYRLKGRRYRYKVNFYRQQGHWTTVVYRKMRMRYWKKLHS